jgi:hypothetical protein
MSEKYQKVVITKEIPREKMFSEIESLTSILIEKNCSR